MTNTQSSLIRNSMMLLEHVYFWTDTIKNWKRLLKQDKYKQIIIDEWKELSDKRLLAVYGFVIMPNHLQVVWELVSKNGNEMPHSSFNKATGHLIVKDLKLNHPAVLEHLKLMKKNVNTKCGSATHLQF